MTTQQAFELALQHHQAGRLAEAEALYRQILAVQPNHADALHLLGVVAHQVGQNDVAVELIRRALALQPNIPEACNNLGNALCGKGRVEEAIAAYRRAIALQPNYPEAHSNLGNALRDRGDLEEAIAAYRRAVILQPNLPEAHSNLGNALGDQGQLDEAVASYHQAITLDPSLPEAHYNLGNALCEKGRLDEAVAAYRQAIALRPNYPEAHSNLGNALRDQRQLDEAIAAYRQAIIFQPNSPETHNNLGNALRDQGRLDEAKAFYHQAIALDPNLPEAQNNLGMVLKDQGQLDEAIAAFRRAITVKPNYPDAHSNLILTIYNHPGHDAETIGKEQRDWNQQHAAPSKGFIEPHSNDPNPHRRLRIGYVSRDLRNHVVGRYLMPLFEHHDRTQFELCCYSGVRRPDHVTECFRSLAGLWRSTVGLGDQQLAELIRKDGVDILVDLSLHTAGNRLRTFARQPAPVQVSYAAYPGSTELEAIEYRISDRYLEAGASEIPSAGSGQAPIQSSEIGAARPSDLPSSISHLRPAERVFLLDSFWCFDPRGADLPVGALPATESKTVTFGCLNNFCKVNDRVLALWARILERVEGSRLLLLSPAGSHRERTLARLRQLGLDGSRVEFVAPKPWHEYLELYHRVDVGLETFPYNGHTTSLDAFWMGVPVPGMVGELPVGRAGLSHLMNLGLPELVAGSEEEYVNLVVKLTEDLSRLAELRRTLRSRMEASVLMDAPRYAHNIETAYRAMWRQWCAQKPAKQF